MKNKFLVAIIGSGFSGQSSAINLIKSGFVDFCILERRDLMGGTWCQNKYPGAAVVVLSPLHKQKLHLLVEFKEPMFL